MAKEDTQYLTKFFCKLCEPQHGKSVFKEPTRKSTRDKTQVNYNELNEGIAVEEYRFTKILQARKFAQESFQRLKGEDLTLEWARKDGLREPVIIESPEGLDIQMPDKRLIVDQVANICGRTRQVDAIEVSTQSERMMTLDEWAKYFHQPPEKRKRILNVISLEISQTPLAEQIRRPRLVRDLDWTDNVWPRDKKLANEYPRVQLYCLMSVKDSYTDFHIDFGGSSVFYHLLSGQKVFYFIPPTKTNLKKYEKWSSSAEQANIFLSDEIKGGAIEVHLYAGNTMIIPTGWIHAVYTPADSIVIGGNFLQGLNIQGQLEIYGVEQRTNVPPKFRFPFFERMQWYAARRYMAVAKYAPETLSTWELDGLNSLISFLRSAATQMTDVENVKKEDRKERRRHVPSDIKNVHKLLDRFSEHLDAAKLKRKSLQSPSSASQQEESLSGSLNNVADNAATSEPRELSDSTDLSTSNVSKSGPDILTNLFNHAEPISDGEDPDEWLSEVSEKEFLDSDDTEASNDDVSYTSADDLNTSADDEDAQAYIPGMETTVKKRKSEDALMSENDPSDRHDVGKPQRKRRRTKTLPEHKSETLATAEIIPGEVLVPPRKSNKKLKRELTDRSTKAFASPISAHSVGSTSEAIPGHPQVSERQIGGELSESLPSAQMQSGLKSDSSVSEVNRPIHESSMGGYHSTSPTDPSVVIRALDNVARTPTTIETVPPAVPTSIASTPEGDAGVENHTPEPLKVPALNQPVLKEKKKPANVQQRLSKLMTKKRR
ncbi:hypothetical protein PhCBS80983_g02920 [Powellomyces hirtus]|uniref:[histone H3]-dimethyl-L-lysine(36) demethylase n=1 Tax=Powellomyces hirtus TaxID=109895 RepID=A0A507E5S3_9FUNG|nr:hypothetical protein PhCBS80983_g02920 [Powellomyces hirtus]